MLAVVLAYHGSGKGYAPLGPGREYVQGSHGSPYMWQGCLSGNGNDLREESNAGGVTLFSGAHENAEVCFEVATNDVGSLELHLASARTLNGAKLPAVTFALR